MLGVRCAGVTVALKALREQGLISYRRGEITIKTAREWRASLAMLTGLPSPNIGASSVSGYDACHERRNYYTLR
jgi:hypothetical protein